MDAVESYLPSSLQPAIISRALNQRLWQENSWAVADKETSRESIRANNWASQCGYECERRLYYERVAQSHKEPFTEEALGAMREGKRHEQLAIQDLMDAGYRFEQNQRRVYIDAIQLSGKMEGYLIGPDNSRVLCEIKSMDKQAWRVYTTIESLLNNQWYRAYVYQLNAYMFAEGQTVGLFIIRNRSNGRMNFIEHHYNPKFWAEIERKFKRVNKAVKSNKPPERINDSATCYDCQFKAHCAPDILSDKAGVALLTEIETGKAVKNITEMLKLKSKVDRYNALNDWKKKRFNGIDSVLIGPFLVTGKQTGKSWRVDIAQIGEAREGE